MKLYKDYPLASDRMGMLWALNGINDACIIEFGPAGTTHFSIEGMMQFDVDIKAKTFTTHLDEHDVTFGNEERLIDAIKELDVIEKPKYLFVLGSSITSIIGIDLPSIKTRLQEGINSQLIFLPDCDFQHDHRYGVEIVLHTLAEQITKKSNSKLKFFNLLGLGISDYNQNSDLHEIKRLMKEYFSLELGTTFILNTDLAAIEKASQAVINLVINKEGLKAAEFLEEKYGQPYVFAKPIGVIETESWLKCISEVLDVQVDDNVNQAEKEKVAYQEKLLQQRIRHLSCQKIFIQSQKTATKHLEKYLIGLGFELVEDKEKALIKFSDGLNAIYDNTAIQISYPCFKQNNQYPYTPMVGYRGGYYLCQIINNTLTKAELFK